MSGESQRNEENVTHFVHTMLTGGAGWPSGVAEWARALTGDRTVNGSAIPFTPPCQCLSDETLKAVGPFYLVPMPGEVKDPTSPHWNV